MHAHFWIGLVLFLFQAAAIPLQRDLAIGDFSALNDLVKGAVFQLPDFSGRDGLILDMTLTNIQCRDFVIGDIVLVDQVISSTIVQVQLDILQVSMTCDGSYSYRTWFFRGSGTFQITSNDNTIQTITSFTSQDYSYSPPTLSQVDTCSATVNINDLSVSSAILGAAPVESFMSRVIENQAKGLLCDKLSRVSTTDLVDALTKASTTLAQYPADYVIEPLDMERNKSPEIDQPLLNWHDDSIFKWGLNETVTYLSTSVLSPNDGTHDMRINVLFREWLLKEQALLLNVTDFAPDGLLYYRHDRLTETSVALDSVKLLGLDSISMFQPLEDIGNQTLQNKISWNYLTFEMNATFDIRPSTLGDSYIVNPSGDTNVVEHVIIRFGLEQIEAIATFFLAVNQELLGSIHLGSLMMTENILPCILSSIVDLSIASLSVDVVNLVPPTLEGFVSPGIDRVVSSSVTAALDMYEATALAALPAFVQIAVRDYLNTAIRNYVLKDTSGCPVGSSKVGEYVDLRDLLLNPVGAVAAGTTGKQPYGNVTSMLYDAFEERVIANDVNGEPKLNSIIRSFTESKSGKSNELLISTEIFKFQREMVASEFANLVKTIEFNVFNASVENLDTLQSPLVIMSPTDAISLMNKLTVGPVQSRPIQLGTRVLFHVFGDNSPLSMTNDVEISLSFTSASVDANFNASILTKNLLQFPLQDLRDIHCWLATFPVPAFDEGGKLVNPEYGIALALSGLNISFTNLKVNATCVSCTSPGGSALPGIINAVEEAGIMKIFEDSLEQLIEEVAQRYWEELKIPLLIRESKTLCPHSPDYDKSAISNFTVPEFPTLSRESIASGLALSLFAAEIALISTAQSHLLRQAVPTNPLSGQASLQMSDTMRILDWSNLNETIGSWAEQALEEARINLNETVDGELTLRANKLLRDSVLNLDGLLVMELDNTGFDVAGTSFSIASISVSGLDTISKIDLLKTIGAQTFRHEIEFDRLDFNITLKIKSSHRARFDKASISIGMANIAVNMSTLVAVDLVQLGEIELQSLLSIDQLLSCFLSKLHDFSISQLLVSVGAIGDPKIEGFLPKHLAEKVASSGRILFDSFRTDLANAIPKICDITIREVFNAFLMNYRERAGEYCVSAPVTADTIDFRDLFLSEALAKRFGGSGDSPYGNTFRMLFSAIQENLSAVDATNQSTINGMIIRPWTVEQSNASGTLSYDGMVINTNVSVIVGGFNGKLKFRISDARFENLDSIGEPMMLLQPLSEEASTLNNTVALGVGSRPIRMTAKLLVAISDGKGVEIENEVNIALEINSAVVFFSIYLALSQRQFYSFPLKDAMNVHCWLSSLSTDAMSLVSGDDLLQYGVTARLVHLNISCVSCSSPRFDTLIDELYSPGDSEGDASSFVNNTLNTVKLLIGSDFLKDAVRRVLDDAATQCPHNEMYDPNAQIGKWLFSPATYLGFVPLDRSSKLSPFSIANLVIAALIFIAAILIRRILKERERKWTESLSKDDTAMIRKREQAEQREAAYLNEHTVAMFECQCIPRTIRLMVPVVILFNCGLYLGGHLGLLAYVSVQGQIAGEAVYIERFLEFSFFDNMIKAFNNGGREMAVLVIIFTGLWPYIKLTLALVLWFLPPKRISVSRRGTIFLWMDVLTKLSIVDIFMMSVAVSAVLIYIGGPSDQLQTNADLYNVKIICVPFAAFYSILIAQRLNRVSSRFFLDYHKKIVSMGLKEYNLRKLKDVANIYPIPYDNSNDLPFPTTLTLSDSEVYEEEKTGDDAIDETSKIERAEEVITFNPEDLDKAVSWIKESFHDEISIPRQVEVYYGDQHPNDSITSIGASSRKSFRVVLKRRRFVAGTIGVILAGIAALILLIIGIILAPAISLEVNSLLNLALDSGRTYEEAVSEYNVFQLIILILLNARFVLNSKWDYVGLGICLFIAIFVSAAFPATQAYWKIREWLRLRKSAKNRHDDGSMESLESTCDNFHRLRAWKFMEVYITSFVIAIWQLGALTAYVIHNYCNILGSLFDALSYIGLVEQTNTKCFRIQASAATTVLILVGSFSLLLGSFVVQARGQYLKNKSELIEARKFEEQETAQVSCASRFT